MACDGFSRRETRRNVCFSLAGGFRWIAKRRGLSLLIQPQVSTKTSLGSPDQRYRSKSGCPHLRCSGQSTPLTIIQRSKLFASGKGTCRTEEAKLRTCFYLAPAETQCATPSSRWNAATIAITRLCEWIEGWGVSQASRPRCVRATPLAKSTSALDLYAVRANENLRRSTVDLDKIGNSIGSRSLQPKPAYVTIQPARSAPSCSADISRA